MLTALAIFPSMTQQLNYSISVIAYFRMISDGEMAVSRPAGKSVGCRNRRDKDKLVALSPEITESQTPEATERMVPTGLIVEGGRGAKEIAKREINTQAPRGYNVTGFQVKAHRKPTSSCT